MAISANQKPTIYRNLYESCELQPQFPYHSKYELQVCV